MDTQVSLKVCITRGGSTQHRRIKLYDPNFDVVKSVVKGWVNGRFTLNYIDDEGDEVLMDTEAEWRECKYVVEKQGASVVKILVHAGGRSRSPSVSSVSSSSSSASVSTSSSTTSEDTNSNMNDDVTAAGDDDVEEIMVPIEEVLAEADEEPMPMTPTAEDNVPRAPTPEVPMPEVPYTEEDAPMASPVLDTVPTPRSLVSEPELPATDYQLCFRDLAASAKVEKILRRLYGGAYVDMMYNGMMTPETLGCNDWLIAMPTVDGCYFEVTDPSAITKKLHTLGEGQMEKHDYEGAALWFEMCTDIDTSFAMGWYNFARAQALLNKIECVNALAMAVGCGGEAIVRKAERDRAFGTVANVAEFKETIPMYDAVEPVRRKCLGCELALDDECLPMQKYCCGRCRSRRGSGHTKNCRGKHPAPRTSFRAASSSAPYRYHDAILDLTSMGFNDVDMLKVLVEKHDGDINKCLLELLN